MSARASRSGLPWFRVSVSAIASRRAPSSAAHLKSALPRSAAPSWPHAPWNAVKAASTAFRTSSRVAAAACAMTSFVEGSRTSVSAPSDEGSHELPMKSLYRLSSTCCMGNACRPSARAGYGCFLRRSRPHNAPAHAVRQRQDVRFEALVREDLLLEILDRLGVVVDLVGEDLPLPEHVVRADQRPLVGEAQRLAQVVRVLGLLRVDEDEVEGLLWKRGQHIEGLAVVHLHLLVDIRLAEVLLRQLHVPPVHLDALQHAVCRERPRKPYRAVARAHPDLERALGARDLDQHAERAALFGVDVRQPHLAARSEERRVGE